MARFDSLLNSDDARAKRKRHQDSIMADMFAVMADAVRPDEDGVDDPGVPGVVDAALGDGGSPAVQDRETREFVQEFDEEEFDPPENEGVPVFDDPVAEEGADAREPAVSESEGVEPVHEEPGTEEPRQDGSGNEVSGQEDPESETLASEASVLDEPEPAGDGDEDADQDGFGQDGGFGQGEPEPEDGDGSGQFRSDEDIERMILALSDGLFDACMTPLNALGVDRGGVVGGNDLMQTIYRLSGGDVAGLVDVWRGLQMDMSDEDMEEFMSDSRAEHPLVFVGDRDAVAEGLLCTMFSVYSECGDDMDAYLNAMSVEVSSKFVAFMQDVSVDVGEKTAPEAEAVSPVRRERGDDALPVSLKRDAQYWRPSLENAFIESLYHWGRVKGVWSKSDFDDARILNKSNLLIVVLHAVMERALPQEYAELRAFAQRAEEAIWSGREKAMLAAIEDMGSKVDALDRRHKDVLSALYGTQLGLSVLMADTLAMSPDALDPSPKHFAEVPFDQDLYMEGVDVLNDHGKDMSSRQQSRKYSSVDGRAN